MTMAPFKSLPRPGPGILIALVGPDASGKTSLALAVLERLATNQRRGRYIHLGWPSQTALSSVLRLCLLGLRKVLALLRGWRTAIGREHEFPRIEACLILLMATEREQAVRKARRDVRNGWVVIADR
jgi:thymidylate kinase